MSSGIDIDMVDVKALDIVCREFECMNDETLDAMCLLIEAEIVARKGKNENNSKTI